MKKTSKRLSPLFLILSLGLSWALLLYVNHWQQQVFITTHQPMLQTIADLLARSVDESLSLKLDYNRDNMQAVYLQETLHTFIQPVSLLNSGYAWIAANQEVLFAEETIRVLPLENIPAPQLVEAVQNQAAGQAVFYWQSDEIQMAHAWSPVSIQGYEWMVGISVPVDELNHSSAWAVHFNRLVGLLAGFSLLLLAFFIWDHTR